MTKKEMISALNQIVNKNDDLVTDLEDALENAKKIQRSLNDLPSEEDEIDEEPEK